MVQQHATIGKDLYICTGLIKMQRGSETETKLGGDEAYATFFPSILRVELRNGGFPPLYIDPIDFMALYRQKAEAAQAAEAAPAPSTAN